MIAKAAKALVVSRPTCRCGRRGILKGMSAPSTAVKTLALVPLVGPFHLRFPNYNAITVRDLLSTLAPEAVAITALAPDFAQTPWQETGEIALPLAVVPWASRQGVPLYGMLEPSPDANALGDFDRYLSEYGALAEARAEIARAHTELEALLGEALTLARIVSELLPLVERYQQLREEHFGDGPGTDWLRARTMRMAERILALPHRRLAVLASADHLPYLRAALEPQAKLIALPEVEASAEAQTRALLDFAMRVEVPEPGNVIARLRELALPEARYHEANLLLAHGHAAEAKEVLEALVTGDFSSPYYLPGYALSRLGQLRDLAGERQAALRAYRGVLALSWAPPEALETAERGLEAPFSLTAATP
jgi:hypothetical protein